MASSRLTTALLCIALGACDLLNGDEEEHPVEPTPDGMPVPSGSPEEAELTATNQARADNGRTAFTWSAALAAVAEAHSQDMCTRNFFSHTNPDGLSPFDRMAAAGITFTAAAENIAAGSGDPLVIHNGWMNSPGHRANILNASLHQLGIGYVECGGQHYWTQAFTD